MKNKNNDEDNKKGEEDENNKEDYKKIYNTYIFTFSFLDFLVL